MRKIVIASDSFKESLSSMEVAHHLEAGIRSHLPEVEISRVPMADGGEGTLQALVDATGGRICHSEVHDPLGRKLEAPFGLLGDGKRAVIEMAAASGLPLLAPEERNPLLTTTYGTGELIAAALDQGCESMMIGIGGSATSDGGAGMFQALGGSLLDERGEELGFGARELLSLDRIDCSGLDPRVKETEFLVASDVTNPLLGPRGAARVYGPQKGASPEMVEELEKALKVFASQIQKDLGRQVKDLEGAGAAGGLGAGLMAFLEAELKPGIELIIEANGLKEELKGAELVITGEGKIDSQTPEGKVPLGVAAAAQREGVPVVAVCGSFISGGEAVYQQGIQAVFSIIDRPLSLPEALDEAPEMLQRTGRALIGLITMAEGGFIDEGD